MFRKRTLVALIILVILLASVAVLFKTAKNQAPQKNQTATSSPSNTRQETPNTTKEGIYVVDEVLNKVFVLDSQTGEVRKEIPVGSGPHDIAISPDKKLIATGNINGSSVSVIDSQTGNVTKTLENIPGAHGVAFAKDGSRLYATSTSTNKLYVYALPSFELERTLATGGFPEYVIDVPVNDKILTTNLTGVGGETYVYKPTWFAHSARNFGTDPHGLSLSTDGTTLAITNLSSNFVYFLAAKDLGETYARIRRVDTGSTSEGAAFLDEQTLWVTNIGADYVSVINTGEEKLVDKITVGPTTHGLAFSKDKKSAFVSLMASGELVKIDVTTRKIVWKKRIGQNLHNLIIIF